MLGWFERFASCCEFWVAIRNCECLAKLNKTKESTLIYFSLDWILKHIACVGWQRLKNNKKHEMQFFTYSSRCRQLEGLGCVPCELCWSPVDFKYYFQLMAGNKFLVRISNFSLLTSSRHRQSSLDHCWSLKLKSLFSMSNRLSSFSLTSININWWWCWRRDFDWHFAMCLV